ncbi:Polyprenyl synthetase [Leadbetterella byssophila DSM 17132]|jgi:geranylgeranyl diphosphate synthase type II|uniref:Polyprenyl synthetase n=1 Tax=Leadbetterella byssophila (strain DSM 17132 / JCM 16389 / KACC 11308 / NBRC 106382 / 4M15) TaxID=649349 RepID=E4RXZ0_LEAB4|nr:polyprenyl synthetase family protein [Leadbetterella byssophila]ADQ19087.1 Polyprenyl synthetase [Leadbetterella byssophila DSM 17132]
MSLERFSSSLERAFEEQVFGEHPAELYEPIHYILSLGGKRIRPLLTLLSANLFTKSWETAIEPAMSVEVFHNFTLMHDDIMDQAPLRRGKPTVHHKWDTNRAILSGDVMLVEAYELLSKLEASLLKKAILRFNKVAAEVCEGQQLDMLFAEREEVSKEEYLEMIRLKTSVLVGYSMELGGIVAGASPDACELLYEVGENLGLGFQMTDDILDVYADPKLFGKQVGGDILENKKTWLLLRAMEKSGEDRVRTLLSIEDPDQKILAVRTLFDELNIKAEATSIAEAYFDKAMLGLQALVCPFEVEKEALNTLFLQIRSRQK